MQSQNLLFKVKRLSLDTTRSQSKAIVNEMKTYSFLLIDYSKTFDTIYMHMKLWQAVLQLGVPKHLVCMVTAWPAQRWQRSAVLGQQITNSSKLGKLVRQGCLLSPTVLITVSEMIVRNSARYARKRENRLPSSRQRRLEDEIRWRYHTLLAKNKDDVQLTAEALKRIYTCMLKSLKSKSEKRNLMCIGDGMIMLEGKNITAEVRWVKFLGSLTTENMVRV